MAPRPRIPNPLGPPAELINALRWLPKIAKNTQSMSKDTRALSDLTVNIARVAEATEGIHTIEARMANIEATMPALVEIQRDLHNLPDVIAKLDDRIAALSALLDELSASMEGLQRSITPLGRIAGRLPGGSKPSKQERELERDPRS